MLRRITLLLLVLLIPLSAMAEEGLRNATSVEEALPYVLFPEGGVLPTVQRGYIRYMTQRKQDTAMFCPDAWMGGEPGSHLDLTRRANVNGVEYNFYAGTMCTRAVYSMALSYLGVDVTPGMMSAMTGRRDLDPPYDEISAMLGVERVTPRKHVFNTMVANYLADPSYSPVYVYLRKPSGQDHALLVIAALPETSRFLVVDPSFNLLEDEPCRVFMISFNKTRASVVNSTFREEFRGSQVLQLYQWRLLPTETEPEN